MKLLYLLLALTLFPLFAAAQPHNENFLLDTAWVYENDYIYQYIYKYDEFDNVIELKQMQYVEPLWVLRYITFNEYDSAKRITKSKSELYYEGVVTSTGLSRSQFDEYGNEIFHSTEHYNKDSLTIGYRWETSYYDKSRKLKEIYHQYYPTSKSWNKDYEANYTYTNDSLLTQLKHEEFNNGSLSYLYISEYSYDNKRRLAAQLNLTGLKQDSSTRYFFTYHDYDSIAVFRFEDYRNGKWIYKESESFDYDNYGNTVLYEREYYDHQWIKDRQISEFDENKLIKRTYYEYKDEGWDSLYRTSFGYDANDSLTQWLSQEWMNEEWRNIIRYSASYKDGVLTYSLYESWRNDVSNWVNSNRFIKEYYPAAKTVIDRYQIWSETEWINDFKNAHVFDKYGNLLSLESERWESSQWVKNNIQYSFLMREMANGDAFYFTYRDKGQSVEHSTPNSLNISLSPNPASEIISISYKLTIPDIARISISSMDGRKVIERSLHFQLPGEHKLEQNVSNLTSGTYFITLSAGSETITKKIVIIR